MGLSNGAMFFLSSHFIAGVAPCIKLTSIYVGFECEYFNFIIFASELWKTLHGKSVIIDCMI